MNLIGFSNNTAHSIYVIDSVIYRNNCMSHWTFVIVVAAENAGKKTEAVLGLLTAESKFCICLQVQDSSHLQALTL